MFRFRVIDYRKQFDVGSHAMNMAVKEKSESVSDEIEWNVDTEVQLFYAMHGHKPVGVNKYFQMVCILEKFRSAIANKDGITSKVIWDHLDTMYDLQALDDTENLPFPNEEIEFSLPAAEFAALMEEKRKSLEAGQTTTYEITVKKENSIKKETVDKKDGSNKDIKNISFKKDMKDTTKDIKKEVREMKEPKKIVNRDIKESRRESKDNKEIKKEFKKENKELLKEIKKEVPDSQEQKLPKPRVSVKKEIKKEEDFEEVSLAALSVRKERLKELSEAKNEESPKRGGKRPTRASIKPEDSISNKSASPITTATPPPMKRRRT